MLCHKEVERTKDEQRGPALALCFAGYLCSCYVFRLCRRRGHNCSTACGTRLLIPPLVLLICMFIKCMIFFICASHEKCIACIKDFVP
jgi:hypothetical protein